MYQAACSRSPIAEDAVSHQASPVKFVVEKVTLGQILLQELRFSPVSITSAMLHTHFYVSPILKSGPGVA
jgi:hypothetical protein